MTKRHRSGSGAIGVLIVSNTCVPWNVAAAVSGGSVTGVPMNFDDSVDLASRWRARRISPKAPRLLDGR